MRCFSPAALTVTAIVQYRGLHNVKTLPVHTQPSSLCVCVLMITDDVTEVCPIFYFLLHSLVQEKPSALDGCCVRLGSQGFFLDTKSWLTLLHLRVQLLP